MISIYHKAKNETILKSLPQFKVGSWISLEDPTEKELEKIKDDFKLEAGILKDARDPFEMPRVEAEKGIIYIITRIPLKENTAIITAPLLIAIGDNFVLTLSRAGTDFIENFKKGKIDFHTTQKTRLVIQFFLEITKIYNSFLINIRKEVMSMGASIENIKNETIIKFVGFEEVLNAFLTALLPTNAVLERLSNGKLIELYEADQDLIEDTVISNKQLVEICNSSRKSIVNIREAYSTILTNNLNRVIKLLTSLTIILTVPTIIGSVYGMNLALPFQNYPHAFSFVLLGIVSVTSFLVIIFRKNNWF